tara:strand:+ start:867 stop:1049 length:183 start_codon:yes stop_codon:yes gene_type:complete
MVVDITSLSLIIPLASGAIVSIISTIQNSKCRNIMCCFGLLSCTREVGNPDDQIIESEAI